MARYLEEPERKSKLMKFVKHLLSFAASRLRGSDLRLTNDKPARTLCGFLLALCLLLLYVGEAAAKFRAEVGGFGGDVDGFGGLAFHPTIEFLGRGLHAAAFASDGHVGFCPALCG